MRKTIDLPCYIGDTVYFAVKNRWDSAIIDGIHIDEQGIMFTWVQYDVGVDVIECWDDGDFDIDDIGKTVFLSREDMIKALEGGGNND